MTTLRQFITDNKLSPETSGNDIEWFDPDNMLLGIAGKDFYIFSNVETGVMCAIYSDSTMPYSKLLSEDEFYEHLKNRLPS